MEMPGSVEAAMEITGSKTGMMDSVDVEAR
jgi:hypothetical protein